MSTQREKDAAIARLAQLHRAHPERKTSSPQPAVHDGMAIASLVLGLVWLGGLGSILAVIFGSISRGEARRAGRSPSGMATAGQVLGWAGIIIVVIVVIALIAASHHAASCSPGNPDFPSC